ncbi:hypothetical protein E2C01_028397 [Portunus trituberculatus]|uniref:Endonuclease/exonuclease/phosphatase domain-containing protein n=1 Tax=Portunus trituberculatus TaxID=210409 RepID=A0A5B7EKC6_PORTR|nr:hypothetical protein [Portunus trituberculatus]
MEHILSLYPFPEISMLGDFNVHHQLSELTFNFAIFHNLDNWYKILLVFLTVLEIRPTFLLFSLSLILQLMLVPYLLRWAPPITNYLCILSDFSNSSSGSPKTEVPLAFCLSQLGGPEEALY